MNLIIRLTSKTLIKFLNPTSKTTKNIQHYFRVIPNGTILTIAIKINWNYELSDQIWIYWINEQYRNSQDGLSVLNTYSEIEKNVEFNLGSLTIYSPEWEWSDQYLSKTFKNIVGQYKRVINY